MVNLRCGVGIVPKLVVEKSLLKDRVWFLDREPLLDPYPVGMCIQKKKMNAALIRAF
ncbi:MAG: hypothetical protein JXA41_16330 [Deltaproteobacteria bacterium]|nr:hypothetical protein [Deltaproteobacteria bacterium]